MRGSGGGIAHAGLLRGRLERDVARVVGTARLAVVLARAVRFHECGVYYVAVLAHPVPDVPVGPVELTVAVPAAVGELSGGRGRLYRGPRSRPSGKGVTLRRVKSLATAMILSAGEASFPNHVTQPRLQNTSHSARRACVPSAVRVPFPLEPPPLAACPSPGACGWPPTAARRRRDAPAPAFERGDLPSPKPPSPSSLEPRSRMRRCALRDLPVRDVRQHGARQYLRPAWRQRARICVG
jgi:hypothetical protein